MFAVFDDGDYVSFGYEDYTMHGNKETENYSYTLKYSN